MPDLLADQITIDDQVRAVEREVGMRRGVYPRWVASGKMKQAKADYEMAAMEAAATTLRRLRDSGR